MARNISIRRIGVDEAEGLREISLLTFVESFGPVNTPENIEIYTSKAFALLQIQTELDNQSSAFYFAEQGGKCLGYLKLNFAGAQTEQGLGNSYEIERIYVLNDYQGHGIGKALYEKALEIGHSRMLDLVWLGVWDQNQNAIGFYEKMGFETFGTHDFKLGTEEQTDLLMRKPL